MPDGKAPALNFGKSQIVKGHGLALPERLRAARGVPQAIVKVASYAHGRSEVMDQVRYISRKGKLEIETESGETLTTREQQVAMVREWSRAFDRQKNSRDTVHLVFSMPHGSDPEALRNSVRKVLHRQFPDHEAVFAIHQDKKHPHAHVVMMMRGRGKKKKLDLRKEDLCHLREVFAEAAREEGVELAASSRAARGVGRKAMKQAAYHMRQRKVVPKAERETAQETVFELQRGRLEEKPWEEAIKKRNKVERDAYQSEANSLRLLAQQNERERAMFLRAAQDLEEFSEKMPKPKTLRQAIIEMLSGPSAVKIQSSPKPTKGREEMER